jgi:hypothetical protein
METNYMEQDDDDPYRTRGMSEYGISMSQKFNALSFTPSNSNASQVSNNVVINDYEKVYKRRLGR